MKTVLLIGHGGYYNRGCEAIVRSTAGLLRRHFGDIRVILASYEPGLDHACEFGLAERIIPHFSQRWTPGWGLARFADQLGRHRGDRFWAFPITRVLSGVDVVLSIGGDNYCYDDPRYFFWLDRAAHRAGKPVALWGASVDVQNITPEKLHDLKSFELITARESRTVGNLAEIGVSSTVRLTADPAFTLESAPVELAPFWPDGDGVLGLNISPLLGRYSDGGAAPVVEAAVAAVRYAVDGLGLGVLLIPHVTAPMPKSARWNDDAVLLGEILRQVPRPGRIQMLPPGLNAMEIKHVIANCRFFIGARTHSTIAALSSEVPTISIGYSVKAEGINLDIFGDTRFLCDIRQWDREVLMRGMKLLYESEDSARYRLKQTIPKVRSRAENAVEHLARIVPH